MEYIPVHPVEDRQKVEALAANMEQNGWTGAPIVVDGEQALTGVHRLAAVELLNKRWENYESETRIEYIPTIEIADVFEEAGLDYYDLHEEYGRPTLDECEFIYLLDELPTLTRDKYGIDLH